MCLSTEDFKRLHETAIESKKEDYDSLFSKLYKCAKGRLTAYLKERGCQESKDLIHDAFISLSIRMSNPHKLEDYGNAYGYMQTIARNKFNKSKEKPIHAELADNIHPSFEPKGSIKEIARCFDAAIKTSGISKTNIGYLRLEAFYEGSQEDLIKELGFEGDKEKAAFRKRISDNGRKLLKAFADSFEMDKLKNTQNTRQLLFDVADYRNDFE